MTQITTQRVYVDPVGSPAEGYRVFVDRLWPRGESKAKFHYDLWAKEIAPSTELREWLHADPAARWPEFEKRYRAELDANPAAAALARDISTRPAVTLLYGSRDTTRNNALVLAEWLRDRL